MLLLYQHQINLIDTLFAQVMNMNVIVDLILLYYRCILM